MQEALVNIVGKDFVLQRNIEGYLQDESAKGVTTKPGEEVVVVKPANTEEISGIMKIAYENRAPVYPRGGGTSLVGGAVLDPCNMLDPETLFGEGL
ncbi:MAG: FAD-binding protein [Candidatus Thermoplasmatota archaeon]|nr:FAD-binding protein [Candidatus Thermoplasmatota archaeon]